MPNPVVRWQIVSPEPEKVATFYQKLFGWKPSNANALGYRELVTEVKPPGPVDGGVWPAPPGTKSFLQIFVEVPDVERSIEKAIELGAKIIVPKSVLPDGDTMAVLHDPTGLPFVVCRLKESV